MCPSTRCPMSIFVPWKMFNWTVTKVRRWKKIANLPRLMPRQNTRYILLFSYFCADWSDQAQNCSPDTQTLLGCQTTCIRKHSLLCHFLWFYKVQNPGGKSEVKYARSLPSTWSIRNSDHRCKNSCKLSTSSLSWSSCRPSTAWDTSRFHILCNCKDKRLVIITTKIYQAQFQLLL